MKKVLVLMLALVMCLGVLAGCGEKPADPADVRVVAMSGPTGMGMVQFFDNIDNGKLTDNNYSYTIAGAADEVGPLLVQSKADIAAVPANLAATLYNNTDGGVQVLAVNTLGVVYVIEKGEAINSVEDLRGKTIYSIGKGTTPEYSLNYVLNGHGIDPAKDVTIEWKAEAAEALAAFMQAEDAIAVLPQPFVTTAQMKNDNIRVALGLAYEWIELQEGVENPSSMITGVVVARTEFINEHPEAVSAFLDHYKASIEFVNSDVEAAGDLVGKYEIVKAEVAKKAIPDCNIVFIEGADMKAQLSGYLNVLFEANPKSVGGKLPADDFYYSR